MVVWVHLSLGHPSPLDALHSALRLWPRRHLIPPGPACFGVAGCAHHSIIDRVGFQHSGKRCFGIMEDVLPFVPVWSTCSFMPPKRTTCEGC